MSGMFTRTPLVQGSLELLHLRTELSDLILRRLVALLRFNTFMHSMVLRWRSFLGRAWRWRQSAKNCRNRNPA